MQVRKTVEFDEQERAVLAEAALSMRVGLPNPDDDRSVRMVGALGTNRGEVLNRKRADEAFDAIRFALVACVEQSDPAWWHENVARPLMRGTLDEPVPDSGGVSIIKDATQFGVDMAATRERQAERLREALDLIHEARRLIGGEG